MENSEKLRYQAVSSFYYNYRCYYNNEKFYNFIVHFSENFNDTKEYWYHERSTVFLIITYG